MNVPVAQSWPCGEGCQCKRHTNSGNPEAYLCGSQEKPNKLERRVLELLPSSWRYVGDGTFKVGRKCPDFWDGGTKLLEVYGDYWHQGDNPQDRIDLFKRHGYDCLVIWEHEVNESPMDVTSRVREFVLA